jgi:hypothetical protein
MKRLLLLLLVGIYGCGLRNDPHPTAPPTQIIATVTPTVTSLAPLPTSALGDVKNPLILALAPTPRVDSNALNNDMRRALTRAFVDAMDTPDGNSAMQTLYGIAAMQVAQDGQYQDFRKVAKASGLDLKNLVK